MAKRENGQGHGPRFVIGCLTPVLAALLAGVLLQTLCLPASGQSLLGVGHDPLAFVSVNPVTGAFTQIGSLPADAVVARAGAVDAAAHRAYVGYETQSANALAIFDTQTGALLTSSPLSFRLDLLVFEGSSPDPTATASPTPTTTATNIVTPTAAPSACIGDCDGSGDVTVDELITLVNIDLGTADASACPHGIPSGVSVDITLIIQAVNNALTSSCRACSFNDPARLPPTPQATPQVTPGSTWPKFRANVQNTGMVSNVTVSLNAQVEMMFPATSDALPKGPFIASPVLNNGETAIYIGSTDGTVYKLSTADLSQDTTFNLVSSAAITSTAVAALRDGQDAIFVGGADGFLYGAIQTGAPQANYWPYLFTGSSVRASPTLSPSDGTVYVGAEDGVFTGVCPNGIARFAADTLASIESSAAIGPDGTVYVGADDRQLRALQIDGLLKWAFAASAPIVTAPVVAVQGSNTFVYVVDLGGRAFKVNAATGLPVAGFNLQPPVMPISSSPALANGHLYFGSDDGNLYAISTADGSPVWSVPTGKSIVSSPAVAIDDRGTVIVVVGSKDGSLYFVEDDGSAAPPYTALALCPRSSVAGGTCDGGLCGRPPCLPNQLQPIESSPAIGSDGTLYVGTDGGRVYAIK